MYLTKLRMDLLLVPGSQFELYHMLISDYFFEQNIRKCQNKGMHKTYLVVLGGNPKTVSDA